MRLINFDNDPHRKKHFDHFRLMNRPHFSLCAPIVITNLLPFTKKNNLSFTATIVYIMSRAAFEITPFRWRIRGEQVVEHDTLMPSFSVRTPVSTVFSFCTLPYQGDGWTFIRHAQDEMHKMQSQPEFTNEPGRDNYLFMTSIPWLAFTSMEHAMNDDPSDSVPRISWGKYTSSFDQIVMPLSVQAHHALVDGYDVGKYFQRVEAICESPELIFC